MTIQVISSDAAPAAPAAEAKADTHTQSAPEGQESSEQKESTESGTEETEASEEERDEAPESEPEEGEESGDDSQKDRPKKKGGFQRRIDKLNSRLAAERQQREALEARLAQIEKGAGEPKDKPSEPKTQVEGKPNPEDFETHAEYVEALTDWKLETRERARQAEEQRSKLMSEQEQLEKAHFERVKSFMEKTPDYEEVITEAEDIEFSAAVTKAILESEIGPQIVYELAKNPAEAKRISSLPPTAAAHAIGKLEAKLELSASEPKKPEPKKLTNAPRPIAPVGGSGKGTVTKSIDDPNLSQAEYEAIRREQMRRRQA